MARTAETLAARLTKDADYIGQPLDLADKPLRLLDGVQPGPMGGEATVLSVTTSVLA